LSVNTEIERKYLIDFDARRHLPLNPDKVEHIDQAYVVAEENISIRVRQKGEKYWLTIKAGQGLSREETEVEIGETTYRKLAGNNPSVTKVRCTFGRWEVDRFLFQHNGLMLAEVELENEDEVVEPPDWLKQFIIREVTHEPAYLNQNLAINGKP
jgi:adenylate cyclase